MVRAMRKISSHTGRGFCALMEEEPFRPRLVTLVRMVDRVLMMGNYSGDWRRCLRRPLISANPTDSLCPP